MDKTEQIKSNILDLLKQETGYVTTKELLSRLESKKGINARKIGRWLTREAECLGIDIVSKYGHNHYKYRTTEPEQVSVQSDVEEILDTIKMAGVDIIESLRSLRTKKLKELETIDRVIQGVGT